MKKKLLNMSMVIVMLTAFITNVHAFTATVSGDWSNAATWGGVAPGGSVINQDIVIPAGITVNLDMDVTFAGLINNFTVDGTLSGANGVTIDQGSFSGSGMVDVTWVTFNALSSSSFTGTLTADKLKNSGATLVLAAIINVSDTLNLDAGSIVLNTGANLNPMANSTIRVNNGTLTIGGGIFNTATNYNLVYVGTSKTTGIEINSTMIQDLHVMLNDNTQSLTLGANLVVNVITHMSMGTLDISGRTLTLKGDFMNTGSAMLTSNATSNLMIEGMASLTDAIGFNTGSSINNLSVDLSNAGATVMLMGNLNIAGMLKLMDGDLSLQSGSNLTMNTGSTIHIEDGMLQTGAGMFTATAAYNVEYMGGSLTTGAELSGAGLNNVTVNVVGAGTITLASDLTTAGSFNLINGTLMLNGKNVTLNGTMNTSPMGMFSSTAASDITLNLTSAAGDTLYFVTGANMLGDLVINISAGSPMILGSPLEIANNLNLMNGKLNIYNSKLTIQSTGMISGYSDTRYIITGGSGKLEMRVNIASPYVVFPVGTVQNFSPASIQQTALGTSGNFSVGVINDVYSAGYSGGSVATTNSLVTRTWFIDAAAAVLVNMNLKLGWILSTEVNGFNRASSYISHYTTMWDSIMPSAAATGAFSTYEQTRMGITDLNTSAFSVMDKKVVAGVDELAAGQFSIFPNPSSDLVNVEFTQPSELKIDILDITGKVVESRTTSSIRNTFDVSALESGFYLFRITDLNSKMVSTKRFVKSK
jgi:hypothetical protein